MVIVINDRLAYPIEISTIYEKTLLTIHRQYTKKQELAHKFTHRADPGITTVNEYPSKHSARTIGSTLQSSQYSSSFQNYSTDRKLAGLVFPPAISFAQNSKDSATGLPIAFLS